MSSSSAATVASHISGLTQQVAALQEQNKLLQGMKEVFSAEAALKKDCEELAQEIAFLADEHNWWNQYSLARLLSPLAGIFGPSAKERVLIGGSAYGLATLVTYLDSPARYDSRAYHYRVFLAEKKVVVLSQKLNKPQPVFIDQLWYKGVPRWDQRLIGMNFRPEVWQEHHEEMEGVLSSASLEDLRAIEQHLPLPDTRRMERVTFPDEPVMKALRIQPKVATPVAAAGGASSAPGGPEVEGTPSTASV